MQNDRGLWIWCGCASLKTIPHPLTLQKAPSQAFPTMKLASTPHTACKGHPHPHQASALRSGHMLPVAMRHAARAVFSRTLVAMPLAAAAAAAPAAASVDKRTLEVGSVLPGCPQLNPMQAVPQPQPAPAVTCMLLQDMRFDNTFVRELPGDKETSNTLRQVRGRSQHTACGGEDLSQRLLLHASCQAVLAERIGTSPAGRLPEQQQAVALLLRCC